MWDATTLSSCRALPEAGAAASAPGPVPGGRAGGDAPVIAVRGLRKLFGRFPAVDRISFEVARGETLALLGPSGCGKTTTLRLLAGLERPDDGSIALAGREVAAGRLFVPPERRGVGLVFQDAALFPHLTVAQNVAFGLRGRPDAARRGAEILALVDLAGLGGRYPHQLSGGQQQRVALARALAPNPQVILLDEPFSNLDADLRGQVRREVQRILRQAGTTAVFVTHDQEEAFELAGRVGVLNGGRLEQLDTPEALYEAPATRFVAQFVGSAEFVEGAVTPQGIRTELGLFPAVPGFALGDLVDVMVRPADVRLVAAPDGRGIVTGRRFRGAEILYSVRLPSGRVVHSSQPAGQAWAPGTRVRVAAAPRRTVAFASLTPWL